MCYDTFSSMSSRLQHISMCSFSGHTRLNDKGEWLLIKMSQDGETNYCQIIFRYKKHIRNPYIVTRLVSAAHHTIEKNKIKTGQRCTDINVLNSANWTDHLNEHILALVGMYETMLWMLWNKIIFPSYSSYTELCYIRLEILWSKLQCLMAINVALKNCIDGNRQDQKITTKAFQSRYPF